MSTNIHDPRRMVDVSMLKQRILYSGSDPEYIGLARPGTLELDKGWQLKKFEDTTAQPTEVNFAQNDDGKEDNGFIFSWVAAFQVVEVRISNELQPGNTVALEVDSAAVTSGVFAVDSDTTLAALATDIAGEAGVATAVVRDSGGDGTRDRVIVVTAAVAGVAIVLDTETITGGVVQSKVEIVTVISNQGLPASLTYGP